MIKDKAIYMYLLSSENLRKLTNLENNIAQ